MQEGTNYIHSSVAFFLKRRSGINIQYNIISDKYYDLNYHESKQNICPKITSI